MGERVKLDVIDVVEPCTEDWGAMRGDERVRFCDACHRNVFDLSAMRRVDAEALVNDREGRLCVRFYRRADGTVTTSDCGPERLAALRRGAKKSLAFAAVAAAGLMAVVGAIGAATALGVVAAALEGPDPLVMGAMPVPDDLPPEPEPEPPTDALEMDPLPEGTNEETVPPAGASR